MNKKIKTILIALIILVAIVAAMAFLGGRSAPTPTASGGLSSTVQSQSAAPNGGVSSTTGNDFATLLSNARSISIDDSLFSNPAFLALRDHPINIGTDVVGRSNPFAPVGNDIDISLASPTVQTLQPGKVTSTAAELSAQISFATTVPVTALFQYGITNQFGSVTTPQVLSSSTTVVSALTGLSPATTYYVQAVAVVGSTTVNGNVMTFTTAAAPSR